MYLKNKKGIVDNIPGFGTALIAFLLVIVLFYDPIIDAAEPLFSFFDDSDSKVSEEEKEAAQSLEIYENLILSINKCKANGKADCICPSVDISKMPDDYFILLEKLKTQGKASISFKKENLVEKRTTYDGELCSYNYDFLSETFKEGEMDKEVELNSKKINSYKSANKIQLFKSESGKVCLVNSKYQQEIINILTAKKQNCEMKNNVFSIKYGILEPSCYKKDTSLKVNENEVLNVYSMLKEKLVKEIGQIKPITAQGEKCTFLTSHKDQGFNFAYENFDKDKDNKISDDVYYISLRVLEGEKNKKTKIEINYYDASLSSKVLSQKIKSNIEKVNYDISMIEKTTQEQGQVFLICSQNLGVYCRENKEIPAVFIDISIGTESDFSQKDHELISEAIKKGVKSFIEGYPLNGYEVEGAKEKINSFVQEIDYSIKNSENCVMQGNLPFYVNRFDDFDVDKDYEIIIDLKPEFEGKLDLNKIIEKLVDYHEYNNEVAEKIKEINKNKLNNLILNIYEKDTMSQEKIIEESKKYSDSKNHKTKILELSNVLIENKDVSTLNSLFDYFLSKTLTKEENKKLIKEFALNLGVAQEKLFYSPKSRIYFTEKNKGIFTETEKIIDTFGFLYRYKDGFEVEPTVKIVFSKDTITVYDAGNRKIQEFYTTDGLQQEGVLELVKYNGNLYWSSDFLKSESQTMDSCFGSITNG